MSSQLQTLNFGAGIVYAYPNGGQQTTDATPQEVGTVQNVKLSVTADIKSLWGQNSWAVDSAIGKRGIKGTVEFAQISGILIQNIMAGSGGSVATGNGGITSYRESFSVPSSTPYTYIAAQVTAGGTFVADGGVIYQASGKPLTYIGTSGTPTVGEYTLNTTTGTYTFAAADEGVAMLVTYSYSKAAIGTTTTIVNTPMGQGPILAMQLPLPYESTSLSQLDRAIFLPCVRFGKLDWTSRLDDYTLYSTDFEAFTSPSTNSPISFYLPW